MAIYHPGRRGLPMTYAHTQPLTRVMGTHGTFKLTITERFANSPMPLARLFNAVLDFFKA